MQNASALVDHYLDRMRRGDRENAFFGLIETDASVLPLLERAFHEPENREICADIVECIWQHRNSQSIQFLSRVLEDPDPEVWKQALDGLVTFGGNNSIRELEMARRRCSGRLGNTGITEEWIDEALDQLCGGVFDNRR